MKLLALIAVAAPAVAHAGPEVAALAAGPVDDAADAPAPSSPPPLPPPVDAITQRRETVGSGRSFLTDTALTVPVGTAELSLRSVVPFAGLATLSGGITRSTELWAETGFAAEVDGPAVYGAGVKQMLASGPNFAVAVTAGVRSIGPDNNRMGMLGAVGTLCNDTGGLMLSGGIQLYYLDDEPTVRQLSVGLSAGSRTTRFIGEYVRFAEGRNSFGLWFLGVRFGRPDMAFELGGVAAIEDDDGAALPYAGFAARM